MDEVIKRNIKGIFWLIFGLLGLITWIFFVSPTNPEDSTGNLSAILLFIYMILISINYFKPGCFGNSILSFLMPRSKVDSKPDSTPEGYYGLIAIYSMGKYQEVIDACEKFLENDPKLHQFWELKGRALNDLGKYQEAVNAYDKALEVDPKSESAWEYKGQALYNLGKYQEAVNAYDKYLKILPRNRGVWQLKGRALNDLGKYQEAVNAYDKALEIDPQYKEALDNKVVALTKLRG